MAEVVAKTGVKKHPLTQELRHTEYGNIYTRRE